VSPLAIHNFCTNHRLFDTVEIFRVNDDENEHVDVVLEECAKNVCKDMFSNLRIQATKAYLKAHSVVVVHFKDHSSTFLTIEWYASVCDCLLIM
jgi:hypothetical protein